MKNLGHCLNTILGVLGFLNSAKAEVDLSSSDHQYSGLSDMVVKVEPNGFDCAEAIKIFEHSRPSELFSNPIAIKSCQKLVEFEYNFNLSKSEFDEGKLLNKRNRVEVFPKRPNAQEEKAAEEGFVDTYSKVAVAKLYKMKTPLAAAADLLNDKVLPLFEQYKLPMLRILTDRGTEYCGKPEQHDYQLYLAVNSVEQTKTKARHP